jgi:hypothetical protein
MVADLSSFVRAGFGLIFRAGNVNPANRQGRNTERKFDDFSDFLRGRKRIGIAFSDF